MSSKVNIFARMDLLKSGLRSSMEVNTVLLMVRSSALSRVAADLTPPVSLSERVALMPSFRLGS